MNTKPFVHPLGDGLFLYQPVTDRAVVLNATARMVWELASVGHSEEGIASVFVQQFGISPTQAAGDVRRIAGDLAILTMPATQADSEVAVPLHANTANSCDIGRAAPLQDCGVFRFGARRVSVRSGVTEMGGDYFSRFRNRSAAKDTMQEGCHSGPPRGEVIRNPRENGLCDATDDLRADSLEISAGPASYRLAFRGEIVSDVQTLIELSADLNELLLHLEHPDSRFLAYFHAAAVSLEGRSVLISGVSGAGKSTLAAYLAGHGFAYLGDDLVAVDAADGTLRTLPTCLSLKAGSWPILGDLYPGLAQAPTLYCSGRAIRYAEPPRIDAALNSSAPPAVVVFPRYRPGARTRASVCTPLETMVRLVQASVDLAQPVDEECISKFVGLVERTPAYELVYSDLPGARRALEALVHGTI